MGLKNYLASPGARQQLVNSLIGIVGAANLRLFYMPNPNEGSVVPDGGPTARNWTHGNSPAGRITRQGYGYALTFGGTDYLSTPDADDLSFVEPAPFSIFVVANLTNLAAGMTLLSKWNAPTNEWFFTTQATQVLTLFMTNAVVNIAHATDAPITHGQWVTLALSCNSAGGASALGATLYQNAAAPAQTATNNASYTTTLNTVTRVEIGSINNGGAGRLTGALALMILASGAWSAGQVAQLHARVRDMGLVA